MNQLEFFQTWSIDPGLLEVKRRPSHNERGKLKHARRLEDIIDIKPRTKVIFKFPVLFNGVIEYIGFMMPLGCDGKIKFKVQYDGHGIFPRNGYVSGGVGEHYSDLLERIKKGKTIEIEMVNEDMVYSHLIPYLIIGKAPEPGKCLGSWD